MTEGTPAGVSDEWALGGLADPLTAVPARAPGSVRRTMHIDVGPRTEYVSRLAMAGAARDLATGPGGPDDAAVQAQAQVQVNAEFDVERRLVSLSTDPEVSWSASLLGARAGGGFRTHLASLVPAAERGSLLRQVLDDMPAAALISGYSWLRLTSRSGADPAETVPAGTLERMTDMCSGWRAGGVATRSVAVGRGVPVQNCPPAPPMVDDDVLGWHHIGVLAEHWMRRRRLIDVTIGADDRFFVFAMFRDTVGEPDGGESVLHEYAVRAVGVGDVLSALEAEPRVLPFGECPAAADEIVALAGTALGDLAAAVPDVLTTTKACTHLNDLLRALGGVDDLVASARVGGAGSSLPSP